MLTAARSQLAQGGVMRTGVNLANVLLVTGRDSATGEPTGVSPDMAGGFARHLGAELRMVPFAHPDALCEAAERGVWDVCLVGSDPSRAKVIDFTAPYAEIEATYMVPAGSPRDVPGLDAPGVRIASLRKGAYDLWLQRNLRFASLVHAESLDESYDLFHAQGLDALAGLRSKLTADLGKHPGLYRVLRERFMAVEQAMGCIRPRSSGGTSPGHDVLRRWVEDAKRSGFVEERMRAHGVDGHLAVPPPAAE